MLMKTVSFEMFTQKEVFSFFFLLAAIENLRQEHDWPKRLSGWLVWQNISSWGPLNPALMGVFHTPQTPLEGLATPVAKLKLSP